jgi:glyoxylase-like metal-dependent hydrolase (beta-lactamase superfamily II)
METMKLRDDIYFYPSPAGLDFTGEINSNTVVVSGPRHIMIDPGLSRHWERLRGQVAADGLDPADIGLVLCSHSHPDHAESAVRVAREVGADLLMSLAELDFLVTGGVCFYYRTQDGEYLPLAGNMPVFDVPDTSLFIKGFPGPFLYGGRQFRLFLTPGHSPGGLCLHWPERGLLVTGDVYFQGMIGSIELHGSSPADMYRSVGLLGGLLDVDLVICGHGPAIEGRQEVVRNYEALFDEIAGKKAKGIV